MLGIEVIWMMLTKMHWKAWTVVGCLLLALLSIGLAGFRPSAPTSDEPEVDRPPSGNRQSDRFAKVRLLDHQGREVDFYKEFVKDKKLAVNFMYTVCKGICPGMTANIKRAREELAKKGITDICFVSISIEPDKDTPERLAAYMEVNGIENREGLSPWVFLTGDIASIDRLRKSMGVFDRDPVVDADRTQHGGVLTFGNDQTNWWGATPALQPFGGIVDTLERLIQTRTRNFPGGSKLVPLGKLE
jgi:protein SCO1/2